MATFNFNEKEFQIIKNSINQKNIIDNSRLLYAADLDYLTARKLYLSWKIFDLPFLTHASQTFEKYLKFISYFIYDNEIEKSHKSSCKFADTDFFKCINQEWQNIIKQLLDEFVWYRYLDNDFSIDIIKVVNTLDKFVLEYYKTLSEMWILKYLWTHDNLKIKEKNEWDVLTNLIPIIYIGRKSPKIKKLIDICIIISENEYYDETCIMFNNADKHDCKITKERELLFH